MHTSKICCYALIGLAMSLFAACGAEEEPLGETCLTLSANVAQSSADELGSVEYEAYADLEVPPLPPEEALERFELEEGFRIEVVAHEPMVSDPVAMDIDADGRLWVVDMPSYMPVVGKGDWETAVREQVPQGRVVVLEDTSGDGTMDTRRVFYDGLVLPRAIKVLSDGVLVGEPPNVWFIRDTDGDGRGDERERVYDRYGDPNVRNVESLPNGLLWGMDNWIHSVDGGVESLRRVDGEWQTRHFERLGQWGITQDSWGRLYSANNTRPLQTHLVPYGYSGRQPGFEMSAGMNASIAPNAPMWPAHAIGSNRSYRIGQEVRESDGTLKRATSTLAPVIYRGDQFGEAYRGNAFTPEPAGNLIKRIILESDPAAIEAEARFAYEGREFLTSTDERFRPVDAANAPDGSLYVVDMYRGVIQHARFLTDHLREYVEENDLDRPTGTFGRIYRIVREGRAGGAAPPRFSELRPREVAGYLSHANGHLRDKAQQVLVQCAPAGVAATLEAMVDEAEAEPYTRLQALWTLEGMSRGAGYDRARLTETALGALGDEHPRVRAAAVRILEPALASGEGGEVLARLTEQAAEEEAPYVELQLLATLGASEEEPALRAMASILDRHAESAYFQEMALTGIYGREAQFAELLQSEYGWREQAGEAQAAVLTSLDEVGTDEEEVLAGLSEAERALFEAGRERYTTCAACHGAQGQGVSGVGPSLAGSEWAQSDPEAVVRILLHGFEGGVAERPRQAVKIAGVMPAHGFLSDEELASILTFVRQSWGNEAPPITPEEVARIREAAGERTDTWSPDELRALQE